MSIPSHRSDGLDFNELIVVTENGDTEKRAGHVVVAEGFTNDPSRRHEVALSRGRDEHARADDVFGASTRLAHRSDHVLDALRCLDCLSPMPSVEPTSFRWHEPARKMRRASAGNVAA